MSIENFFHLHPRLYHMAWEYSWPSILQHGLLSTQALLDLYEYTGESRGIILAQRRPENVRINHPSLGTAVIRDQKPISDTKLARCLSDGMTVSDWYAFLNQRVFFWTTQSRLFRLMSAAAYRNQKHCILEIDSHALYSDYASKITLSPINSGSTFIDGPKRGLSTFSKIEVFPYDEYRKKGRKPDDAYVELTVDYAVYDIMKYICSVNIMRSTTVIERIFP